MTADTFERIHRFQRTAATSSLREIYPLTAGKVRTLSDGELSAAIIVARQGPRGIAIDDTKQDRGALIAAIPQGVREHYEQLRDMQWPFFSQGMAQFDRVVLLGRSGIDGMLIGFANNDLYYVLATFDTAGVSLGLLVEK